MKKALLAALCFIVVSLMLVNGTFALPDLDKVFQWIEELGEKGMPEIGGEGTAVHVALVSDDETRNLYPGSEVSRSFQVENQGTGNVYFRLVYAVQYDAESWEHLNVSFDAGAGFTEERSTDDGFDKNGWKDIEIDDTPYKMKVFTYKTELTAGKNSSDVSISIAMDATVTSEQIANYDKDFLRTQVLAIETESFNDEGYLTAEKALDAALPLKTLNPF